MFSLIALRVARNLAASSLRVLVHALPVQILSVGGKQFFTDRGAMQMAGERFATVKTSRAHQVMHETVAGPRRRP